MKWNKQGAGWSWKRAAGQSPGALGLTRDAQGWQMVQLAREPDGGVRMVAASRLGPVAAGDPESMGADSLRLQDWMAECACVRESRVVAGLPRSSVRVWRMTVPAGLEEADLEHMARVDAQSRHGLLPDVWQLDFGVVPAALVPERGEVELLVAAAPRAEVDGWQQVLGGAGLKLGVLEVAAHAVRAAALRAWRVQVGEVAGRHGIVVWTEDSASLLWMLDGALLAEQALEVETLADLAGVLGHACRGHVTSLRGLWLAVDEAAEQALMQPVQEALHGGVAGTEVSRASVQWLHPWAGMRVEDAGLQRLSAIEASGWWAACGLALRGVDAWSR